MKTFVLRRLLMSLLALFVLLTLTFVLVRAVPGDPARYRAGFGATAEQLARARSELGLDKSYLVQYLVFLRNIAHGDLGKSVVTNRSVLQDIGERLPCSVELAFVAALLGILIGIPIGTIAAVKQGTWFDHLSRVAGLTGVCIPTFWLGLMLQVLFYSMLGWLPIGGKLTVATGSARLTGFTLVDSIVTGNFRVLGDYMWHMVLPAFCLCQGLVALLIRLFRSSLLEVLNQEYMKTARGKGLSELRVIIKHAARNALVPVISLSGVYFGLLVGSGILVETIFSWPGMGTYLATAIASLDYSGILGGTLALGVVFVLANLAADVALALLSPTLRYQ